MQYILLPLQIWLNKATFATVIYFLKLVHGSFPEGVLNFISCAYTGTAYKIQYSDFLRLLPHIEVFTLLANPFDTLSEKVHIS